MKSLLNNQIVLSVTVLTALLSSVVLYTEFSSNYIDESGQRQGYWVITGEMVNEIGFSSSAIVEEGPYVNDLKSGVWKKYYPSGNIRSEITYVDNKPVGDYILYYENGVVEESGNWQRTKNTGQFERNYSNGNPHQRFKFSDSGKRNGEQLYYHENGNLALQVNLLNGKETGVMKRFDEDGNLSEEKSFDNGSFIGGSTKNYQEEEVQFTPKPVAVDKQSDIKETPTEPKNENTNSAHHFKPNGHNILYDLNRNVSQSGLFKDGRLWNGKWFKYNKNGILLRVDVYRNGRFIGHGLIEKE